MTPQPTPTTQNLYAIDGVPGALVAVGQGGTIVRRQVSGWVLDVSPTQEDLFAVALLPYGKGVAVGRNGVMLRLGDGRWSLQPVLTSLPLNAVSMLESGAGFAVGGAAGGAGVALRFNGFSWWVLEPPDPLPALFGLAPAGGLDAWGVGVNGFVVRFPVAGDVVVDRVAQASILDSWATMDGVGFAVTVQGSILRQDGRTFVQDSVGHPALLGVAGYPHALAVGEQGTVLARVHGAWVNVPSPSRWNLWDVHVDEENVAWVVGDHGEIHRVQ